MNEDQMTKEEFLANRVAAGRAIDVETCEIYKKTCSIMDPYGVDPDDSCECIGRVPFVRSAESHGWVCVYDLPKDKARALHDRIERGVEQEEDLPWE
jgi:hypothetical protein